jgi:hypothetical protein
VFEIVVICFCALAIGCLVFAYEDWKEEKRWMMDDIKSHKWWIDFYERLFIEQLNKSIELEMQLSKYKRPRDEKGRFK